jgi:hypothetical protein
MNYPALIQHICAVGGIKRQLHVCSTTRIVIPAPSRCETIQTFQHRHDSFRWLIEHDEIGLCDHRTRDGQHLLLAAGRRHGFPIEMLSEPKS